MNAEEIDNLLDSLDHGEAHVFFDDGKKILMLPGYYEPPQKKVFNFELIRLKEDEWDQNKNDGEYRTRVFISEETFRNVMEMNADFFHCLRQQEVIKTVCGVNRSALSLQAFEDFLSWLGDQEPILSSSAE